MIALLKSFYNLDNPETVARMCYVKHMFLKISQNLQENICPRVSFLTKLKLIKKEILTLVFSCDFCEIIKNTSFYRTPAVAASHYHISFCLKTCHTQIVYDGSKAVKEKTSFDQIIVIRPQFSLYPFFIETIQSMSSYFCAKGYHFLHSSKWVEILIFLSVIPRRECL